MENFIDKRRRKTQNAFEKIRTIFETFSITRSSEKISDLVDKRKTQNAFEKIENSFTKGYLSDVEKSL